MNRILLQKIEELTLHLIQQEERIRSEKTIILEIIENQPQIKSMNKLLVLFLLLSMNLIVLGQSKDSSRFQFEFSGMGFKVHDASYLYFNMGVNLPAKKPNWYNSFSLTENIRDNSRSGGALSHYSSFSATKNYQFIRKHFFLSAGFGAGVYYGDYSFFEPNYSYSSKYFGLVVIPRLEFGLNFQTFVISTGVYYAVGGGNQRRYENGSLSRSDLGFYQTGSPYLKLIIK